jgi:LPS export ABC transporter protein LptC
MRLPVLSWGIGACALLAGVALAQNAGAPGAAAQSLPVGQTFKQFTFPVYGPDGQLRYTFFATEATGITINRAEADNLRIDVYENGQKTTTITSPKADLYVAEQKMRTKNTVRIERTDMEATSEDCDFDVKKKIFFLRTSVKVLLKHFDVGAGSGAPPKTPSQGQASTGAKPAIPARDNAEALPAPDPAKPMPTDDSILPSPGAYSDTNAAPLPPSSSPTR